jgi:hypothetical protein
MATRRRDLGSKPTAERKPEQADLVAGQRVEGGEVEVHQIVDRIEVLGPQRAPEAGG